MFRMLFLLVTLAVPAAVAQQPLSSDAATAVVKEATRLVRENYVFADKVDGIVTRIEKQLADGRYAVTDPQQLATRLTAGGDQRQAHERQVQPGTGGRTARSARRGQ